MTEPIPVNPIKSKLGREIYALAAILASLPILVIGAISVIEVEDNYRERAYDGLEQSVRTYGELLFERLRGAADIAGHRAQFPPATEVMATHYEDFAVYSGGNRVSGDLAIDATAFLSDRANARTRLWIDDSGSQPQLVITRTVDNKTFIGLLSRYMLFGDETDYPYETDFCVLTPASPQPVYCSEPIPNDVATTITGPDRISDTLEWEHQGTTYLSAYWELFTESALDAEPFRIIASQPESVALEAVAEFRSIYLPGLLVTLGFTLLASGFYARRTLNPLSQLLDLTKRYGARDFSVRASLERDDEFKDLADALDGMASDLSREFQARESLSRIDRMILTGGSEAQIARTALEQIIIIAALARADLFLFDRRSLNAAQRYSRSVNGDRLERETLIVSNACQIHLAAHQDSWLLKPPIADEHLIELAHGIIDPFLLFPIRTQDRLRGVLRCVGATKLASDPLSMQHVRELAERIAVAIEYADKNARLHRQAFFDDLTGLPNRQSCFQQLDAMIATASQKDRGVALMFIDLDGFKAINDTLGHVVGDELLHQAANRITRCLVDQGFTARLGGDEFAVVMPFDKDGRAYKDAANRILAALRSPFQLGSTEANLGASIGTARFPEDGSDHTELLRKADAAMYRAKESGRGQRVDYSMTMGLMIDRRLRLETDMMHALEREELELLYQPQMDLKTVRIDAAEALLRWNHGKEGPISPAEFIPIAEESGYIITIGNWVLYHACRQLHTWRQHGVEIGRIAVNVSARQLRNREFIQRVEDCIHEFGLAPGELELELTESTFVDDEEIESRLAFLKKLGVGISIDDFGTGFSSLGYLRKLVFDTVKIDRAFVNELPDDREAAAIVKAVVAMCHTLDKSVVAEGIETERQLDYLADAGVDIGQGFYLGKPMSAAALANVACESTVVVKRLERKRIAKLGGH